MKQVAKLIVINSEGKHLLMYRSKHPTFGNDPDLPGGTLEAGESPLETMVREVFEESGIVIDSAEVKQVYVGTDYSAHGTCYSLFVIKLDNTPKVSLSWEHSAYEWLDLREFLAKAKVTQDSYMQMVYSQFK